MMHLANADETTKGELLDYLERALSPDTNHVWRKAPFDGYAEKNRKGLRDHQTSKKAMPTLKTKIKEAFPEFSEELQEQFEETFHDAVRRTSAREALTEILDTIPGWQLMFAEDSQIDIVDQIAERIQFLEQECETIEEENDRLRIAAMQRDNATIQQIKEDVMFTSPLNSRRSTRNVAEEFEADPDNAYLLEDGGDLHTSGAMAARVAYLNRTIRHVDQHKATDGLLETWELQNK